MVTEVDFQRRKRENAMKASPFGIVVNAAFVLTCVGCTRDKPPPITLSS
jgi:hypothetical protein